jgi:hypothetical protein
MKKSILCVILILALFCSCKVNEAGIDSPKNTDTTEPITTAKAPSELSLPETQTTDEQSEEANGNILEFTAANPEITVTKGGNYVVTGSTANGRLVVNAGTEAVTLTLQDVSIESQTGSAIRVRSAGSVEIIIPEGSNSVLISSADDDAEAISSNSDLTISGGGGLQLSSNGNGIHSDSTFTMTGGTVMINRAEEGIEAAKIIVTGGSIAISSFEDGINVSDGTFSADSYNQSGGRVYINASGDGLDSNNIINITGGTLIIEGPTAGDNAAIDFDRAMIVDGGTVIAVGSRGMNVYPTGGSQTFIAANISANAGETVIARDTDENEIAAIVLSKSIGNVIISTAALTEGETVNIYVSGDSGERLAATVVAGEEPRIGFQGSPFGGWNGDMPENGRPPDMPTNERPPAIVIDDISS